MKHTIQSLLGVLFTVLGTAPCAHGQQIPLVAEGDAMVHTTLLPDNRLRMVDVANDHPIILSGGLTFDGFAAEITGQVRMQEQPTGFDLIYTFVNTGNQPARLGRLNVGKFNLGNNIYYRDFRHIGEPVLVDYNNYAFQAFPYPHGLYSPVWALYNEDYAVGISLQYPVMTYQHEARVMLGSTPFDAPVEHGPRGWFVEYRLANLGGEPENSRLRFPGTMPAGATYTYVVSVRVSKNPQGDWIRTFTPYRDYFRSMYGGVQYQRDTRPIHPVLVALNHLISEDNPYGFDNFGNRRPDRVGWAPWAAALKADTKYQRVMLWAPTGLYDQNRERNLPSQFTSRWLTEDRMGDVFNEETGLPSLARRGMSLGLWWGRSTVISREWNSAQWENLDPNNPAHVQAAFHEMDLAVRAGAKEIGLDAFGGPIWITGPWLERMREAYPGVKFCIEPITCDIMHRLGPTYVLGWPTQAVPVEADLDDLDNPFYLADLLLPGHESWGARSYHVDRRMGHVITPQRIQADMERYASYGYVPLMYEDVPAPENIRAGESWLTTLPADVLRGSGWNVNFNAPRAHRQPDGRLVIINDSAAPARPSGGVGRVGGFVPNPPGAGPGDAPADDGNLNPNPKKKAGEETPTTPATPAIPAAPIERTKKKIHGSIRVQTGGVETPDADRSRPEQPSELDMPGHASVSVPSSAGKGVKGKGNSAWLEAMARRGRLDRAKINQAVKKMHSEATPTDK